MSRDGSDSRGNATPLASPTGNPPGRFENSLNTQRKLQATYREKQILLAEVQSLKQQLRATNKLVGLGDAERLQTWNRLLETNLKSGTLACVYAIKSLLARRLSSGFFRWRLNARLTTMVEDLTAFLSLQSCPSQPLYSSAHAPMPQRQLSQTTRAPSDTPLNPSHASGQQDTDTDAAATLRLLNSRRLGAMAAAVFAEAPTSVAAAQTPSSSGARAAHSTPKSSSTRSAGSAGLPRYLSATKSSQNSQWSFHIDNDGNEDVGHELQLVEGSPHRPGISVRGGASREADLYGFDPDGCQPFSPVREREKRRSKSNAMRSGGGYSSYMAPTSSASKKKVLASEFATNKSSSSSSNVSPTKAGGRNLSHSLPPTATRGVEGGGEGPGAPDSAPAASPAPQTAPASSERDEDEDEDAQDPGVGNYLDGLRNKVNGVDGGSIGGNGSTGSGDKAKGKGKMTKVESAQLRLFEGVGENLREKSYDSLLRRY